MKSFCEKKNVSFINYKDWNIFESTSSICHTLRLWIICISTMAYSFWFLLFSGTVNNRTNKIITLKVLIGRSLHNTKDRVIAAWKFNSPLFAVILFGVGDPVAFLFKDKDDDRQDNHFNHDAKERPERRQFVWEKKDNWPSDLCI